MLPALIVLGISTILNAIYFLKTVIRIYTPVEETEFFELHSKQIKRYATVLAAFMLLNVFLGVMSEPITSLITAGLEMFS